MNPISDLSSSVSRLPSPVLITGVTGFIASHLAERLLAEGIPVRGTARRPLAQTFEVSETSKVSPAIEVVPANLLDVESLRRAADGQQAARCRAVVHAAAWTGGPELSADMAWRTNVEGTANVLAAAESAGVERFVYISSVAVYGVNAAPLIDEAMPTPPVGQLYPDSKIAAEALVRASPLPWVIVRPASTYGPRGGAWSVGPIEQIKAGRLVLLGRDAGLVTTGYIDNVVDGLLLALAHPAAVGETFNLCDDRAVTFREFYLAYAHMLGKENLPTVPGWFATLARTAPASLARRILGRPTIGPWSLHFRRNPSQFSVAKAKRMLGYAPEVGFEEGMQRTEAWLRTAGYLS
jgi:nucleoside-diphosphate-sugar epimerase